jgi:hypothetical protein
MAYWVSQGGANLGIVGDLAHQRRASYHNGQDAITRYGRTATNDYSIRHPRDREPYLTNAAAGTDLGRLDGSLPKLYTFSKWLVEQCRVGAPGTRDIREVIYSPDGKVVKRWDNVDRVLRSGWPVATGQGDQSHIWHTHVSWFRDSEARSKAGVFAPYFGGIDVAVPIAFFERPRLARLTAEAVLYEDPGLSKVAWQDLDQTLPDGEIRYYLYPGKLASDTNIAVICYEPLTGDTNSTSTGYFAKLADVAGSVALESTITGEPIPVDPSVIEAAKAEAAKLAVAAEQLRVDAIRDAAIATLAKI